MSNLTRLAFRGQIQYSIDYISLGNYKIQCKSHIMSHAISTQDLGRASNLAVDIQHRLVSKLDHGIPTKIS